jgi:histidyl-tRNA synthetase
VFDKLQKAGIENVRKELGAGRVDESGDSIIGVGLTAEPITRILKLFEIKSSSRRGVVDAIEKLLPDSKIAQLAIAEMRLLDEALTSLGVWESEARFDVSLTRGLDYYTGPVFEAFLPMAVDFGSVMGGGRYDQLVARFLDKKIPATGASIGLERLLAGLKSIGKVETQLTTTKVLVVSLAGVPVAELLSVAKELRDKGLSVEVYFGSEEVSMREQLAYANEKDIPVAVIIGTDELASGKVSVKNLIEGRAKRSNIEDHAQYRQAGRVGQSTVSRAEMVPTVLSMLG